MQGIWVVTHTRHHRFSVVQPAPTASQGLTIPAALLPFRDREPAVPLLPSSLTVGCGEVDTFVPKFGDGGVEPFGLTC